jgi:branched-subunit amino acid transport protein
VTGLTNLIAVVLTGLGTYATRAAFIVGLGDRSLPRPVERGLEYVGPAVIAALVVTLMIDESGSLTVGVPEAAALGVGAVVAWWLRSLLAVVLAGMAAYWVAGIWF